MDTLPLARIDQIQDHQNDRPKRQRNRSPRKKLPTARTRWDIPSRRTRHLAESLQVAAQHSERFGMRSHAKACADGSQFVEAAEALLIEVRRRLPLTTPVELLGRIDMALSKARPE